eukprot:m.283421 g.283421  ORF g.283421 m.283421 type:complete len:200 (-) comp19414_c0_seq9:107-706(-)
MTCVIVSITLVVCWVTGSLITLCCCASTLALKLADFGLATQCKGDHSLDTMCGSPSYVAPEIIRGDMYGKPVDMWSFGVVMFTLLGGFPPFYHENERTLFLLIKAGHYEFDPLFWGEVSESAKSLIARLLVVDPSRRMTARQAIEHEWLQEAPAELEAHNLASNLVELRRFLSRRKLRGAVHGVILMNRLRRLTGEPAP